MIALNYNNDIQGTCKLDKDVEIYQLNQPI